MIRALILLWLLYVVVGFAVSTLFALLVVFSTLAGISVYVIFGVLAILVFGWEPPIPDLLTVALVSNAVGAVGLFCAARRIS